MDLQSEILKEHSRHQADRIIKWIGKDQKKFDQLVNLFLRGDAVTSQRAGWPLSDISIRHPKLVQKHLKKLLINTQKTGLHNAVLRNTVRLLQFVEIPKQLHGLATDTCFRLFNDQSQPVAVRCFAMTVLSNLCKTYPELAQELTLSIQDQLPFATAGFKSRAKKTQAEIESVILNR
jgi:hypothetical protein